MKILLFGGSGQLGHEVMSRAHDLHFEVIAPVVSEVDITELGQVLFLTKKIRPAVVINCAAYTSVDQAEEDIEEAYHINRDGARKVAQAVKEIGSRLIYISTDYVFDGQQRSPIPESQEPNPLSVYGKSKLAGEEEIKNILGDKSIIVRTSSLHGQKGINFVHTMIKLFSERETLKVVNDQFMSPTWAGWLAEVLLDLSRISCGGVVHVCGAGATTWYDFASEIYKLVSPRLKKEVRLEPISAEEFGRPAKRPIYSVLDCSKLTSLIGRKPISWQEGLKNHLRDIGYIT